MNYTNLPLTIAAGASESESFQMQDVVGDAGLIMIPAGWTAAGLGFKVSSSFNGAYAPLRNEGGGLVEVLGIQTGAAAWYKLPDALRGAFFVRLWSENAGSNVNQVASRSLVITAKG